MFYSIGWNECLPNWPHLEYVPVHACACCHWFWNEMSARYCKSRKFQHLNILIRRTFSIVVDFDISCTAARIRQSRSVGVFWFLWSWRFCLYILVKLGLLKLQMWLPLNCWSCRRGYHWSADWESKHEERGTMSRTRRQEQKMTKYATEHGAAKAT